MADETIFPGALVVNTAGVGAVNQRGPDGNVHNVAMVDSELYTVLGPGGNAPESPSVISLAPFGMVGVVHVQEHWHPAADSLIMPKSNIGNGATTSYGNQLYPSHMNVTTAAVAVGDGANFTMGNMFWRPNTYADLRMFGSIDQETDIDFQFGWSDAAAANQIMFRYAAGSTPSTLKARITNPSGTAQIDTGLAAPKSRTILTIQWPNRYPSADRGPVKFRVRDGIAHYDLDLATVAEFELNHANLPADTAYMRPFLQIRSNGAAPSAAVMHVDAVDLCIVT